jgi:hypothetical protein
VDDATIEILESVANTLRGMGLDKRIPEDAREVLTRQVAVLDRVAEAALAGELGYDDNE